MQYRNKLLDNLLVVHIIYYYGVMQYRNKLLDNRDVQFMAVPDN